MATVGLLLTIHLRLRWLLMVIPVIWLLFSALTYLAMEITYGVLPLLLVILAALSAVVQNWGRNRPMAQ